MKRILPSNSTNKRKRQDAFTDASPFDYSTPRKAVVNTAVLPNTTELGVDAQRRKAAPSTTAASHQSKGIMAFSPMPRAIAGTGKHLLETPSKASKIPSAGLPVPTRYPLPPAPGLSPPVQAESPFNKRGGSENATGSARGSSLARNAMTPLSALLTSKARVTGFPSPKTDLARNRNLHALVQPDLFLSREGLSPSRNESVSTDRLQQGLPTMLVESDPASLVNTLSKHKNARSKWKAGEGNQDSLTKYLNRLLSKQQASSSLFLANLSLSSSHSVLHGKQKHKTDLFVNNSVDHVTTSSILATADIVVKIEQTLLPVQHASPIFACKVLNTSRTLSLKCQSANPSDQLLVSFSGHIGNQSRTTGIPGMIDPCRLARTMRQLQLQEMASGNSKEIIAGIWQPWYEVVLDGSADTAMPQVVLLCSRFLITET